MITCAEKLAYYAEAIRAWRRAVKAGWKEHEPSAVSYGLTTPAEQWAANNARRQVMEQEKQTKKGA